jgi:hypothetical protein
MDFITDLPVSDWESRKYNIILAMVCPLTKYAIYVPCKKDDAGASALARTSYMNNFLNEYLYRDLVPFDPGCQHYKNLQIVSAPASNAAPEDEIVYPSFCRPLVIAEPNRLYRGPCAVGG